jgi:methionyl-tRNA formyltransferase
MRGFAPWPGAYTSFRGQTCHLWAEPFSLGTLTGAAPGTILREGSQILIACGHATLLRLISIKVEGRKQISAVEFGNGARLTERERFDNA